jgi:hypothetical protein
VQWAVDRTEVRPTPASTPAMTAPMRGAM